MKHYFVRELELGQDYSAARYEQDALAVISSLSGTHHHAVLSGGSMMYVDAVCQGIDDIPTVDAQVRADLKARFEQEGLEPLLKELERLDPEYFRIVDHKNHKRVIHALEICHTAGCPYSRFRVRVTRQRPFNIIKVDRENGFALASRKSAMKTRRSYFAHRTELNAPGTRLKCRVIDVGPVRCTVECYGHDIRLTQKDLCYMSVSDLRAVYRPGQELDCVVTDYDADEDRLRVSVKAALSDPFEGAERRHPVNSRRQAVISGKYAGGVFCNLPDGTVCMCSYAYQYEDSDFESGDTVILTVKRFDSNKRQMYGKILSKW